MVGTVDYISYAHIEARKSVPDSVTEFFMKVGRYFQADWLLSKLTNNVLSKFVTLNLELQAIHDKLLKEELLIENPQEDYKSIRDIVRLLTRADEIFETIDYFENPNIKAELKSALNNSYLIEVEIRALVFKSNKSKIAKDEMFIALSNKSKESLSRAV
jgi:hypothetical protein